MKFQEIPRLFIASFWRPSSVGEVTTIKTTTKTATIPSLEIETTLLAIIRENLAITLKELATKLKMTRDGARYHIGKLKDKGILRRIGTKNGYWEIVDE